MMHDKEPSLQLLETIEKNGEFEKYVVMLAEREDKEHRELRRRERERKRLEQGDNYISENDSLDENDEEDEDDEDDSDYDSEAESVSYMFQSRPIACLGLNDLTDLHRPHKSQISWDQMET